MLRSLVGSEMCIRDRYQRRVRGGISVTMKLVHSELGKDTGGSVTMVPEHGEDLWIVYNLVREGDRVKCTTVRKVSRETASGSTESDRIKLTLEVEMVGEADFDPVSYTLRVKGSNKTETPHVRMNSSHTLELCIGRKFTLTKPEWDQIDMSMVERASNPQANADMAAVVMAEGLANICLVTESMTVVRHKVQSTIPKKHTSAAFGRDKAVDKFFEQVLQGMLQHIDLDVVKVVVVASPGSVSYTHLTLPTKRIV
eukprot:TRINITY_DN11516_c0_g1_i3.p1 TRINITY_DN11516_c0_g1~~TRINITY_DN11516_c0_g1_i3.p1  ORF type:complete len:255 (+),score=76.52 TRINITY_DN11516_c0_g1_i3:108-872(+)